MNLDRVTTGNDVPHEINVVIEIPMNSDPIKYELDKSTGAMFVDRFVSTSMHYPCNYGYIPHTLADDGDPVDVLVVTPFPVVPGVVVRCRPVGMLAMTDEAGGDTKLLAVPIEKLSPLYRHVGAPQDFAPLVLDQIQHFFAHYKDLEPGKWVKIEAGETPMRRNTRSCSASNATAGPIRSRSIESRREFLASVVETPRRETTNGRPRTEGRPK